MNDKKEEQRDGKEQEIKELRTENRTIATRWRSYLQNQQR